MTVLRSGTAEYPAPDPDSFRQWVRTNKPRGIVDKLMSEHEAISKFVSDGDYICYDCAQYQRGANSLIREVIRQRKKDLWVGARFSYTDLALLYAGGCAAKADIGFQGGGATISEAARAGKIKLYEWGNAAMVARLQAGAMGLPFMPVRYMAGTDTFEYSGAKLIDDPFSGRPITVVPALNPDVSIIHVHQSDVYGNARIFGTSVSPVEEAMASRKVILQAEEIIDHEEVRRNPGRTTIPYLCVDAVVLAPFGGHPGNVPGYYVADEEHLVEQFGHVARQTLNVYLEKYVYSVESHEEYLEKRVGIKKLLDLKNAEQIKEGYRA